MAIIAKENSIGAWAFLIGVILAVLIGLSTTILSLPNIVKYSAQIYGILVVLGIVIGFVWVPGKDSQTFLWTGAILVIVSSFGMQGVRGSLIRVTSVLGGQIPQSGAQLLQVSSPAHTSFPHWQS